MHVVVATDGSRQSLAAAEYFRSFADPVRVSAVTVVAVVRPLAAVAFADDLVEETPPGGDGPRFPTHHEAATGAVRTIAQALADWGPPVHEQVRSGSPASEIIAAAEELDAGLVVVASGSRGLSETVLLGSTAQRVQQYAPCPVLVVRPEPRPRRRRRAGTRR